MSLLLAPAPLTPLTGFSGADAVLDRFLEASKERGLQLYAEQEVAILGLFAALRHVNGVGGIVPRGEQGKF